MRKDKKSAQDKWAKFGSTKPDKPEAVKIEEQRSILLVTHTLQESSAEVLLPKEYEGLTEKELIVVETKDPIVVQVCRLSKSRPVEYVSILKQLADQAGVEYQQGGKFRSTIRLEKHQNYPAEFVELLVKDTFMSRRDQYKITDYLNKSLVYIGKVLNFQGLKMTVMSMMNSNELIKRGVINPATKVIYRTGSSKYTILLELSKETFEIDLNQQTYVEKAVQFISAFGTRNSMFQNSHRVDIVLFSRLYYPQLKTLNQAYDEVLKFMDDLERAENRVDRYSLNFAVAFQIDPFGNIYEDVYRKVTWKKNYGNLSSYLWKKIGEFLYTINWKRNVKPFAEFILKRVRQEMDTRTEESNSDNSSCSSARKRNISNVGDPNFRIRPFLRFLECEVCDSRHCNVLEAINLTANQYSKHYYGRSLYESGSAITVLTTGHGKFYTDPGTYRLAKSSVYLNNISCVMVCIRNGVDRLEFIKTSNGEDPVIDEELQSKLSLLLYGCLDEYIYSSPLNERPNYDHNNCFQNRIGIRGDSCLKEITDENVGWHFNHFHLGRLKCKHKKHYISNPPFTNLQQITKISKTPDWIQFCNFNQQALKQHQFLYDNKISEQLRCYESSSYRDANAQQMARINKVHQTFDRLRSQLAERDFCSGRVPSKVEAKLTSAIKRTTNGEVYFDISNANAELFKLQVLKTEETVEREMSSSGLVLRPHRQSVEFDMLVEQPNQASQLMSRSSMSNRPGTEFQNVNIFEVDRYEAPKHRRALFAKASHRKHISHYRNRLKFNFRQSKIHMLMPSYRENMLRLFRLSLHRNECPPDAKRLFTNQHFWKLLCFPLLTPIKTAYSITNQVYIQRATRSIPSTDNLEQVICQKLSQNFQLVDTGQKTSEMIEQSYHLAKGSLYHHIIVQDRVNLNIRECQIVSSKETIQDEQGNGNKQLVNRMDRRHSDMMYRYLCYEEKEYRFVGRHCYFTDQNNWRKDDTAHTKIFKISFVIDASTESTPDRQRFRTTCRQNFRQYIQAINEKYQGQVKDLPMVVTEGGYKDQCDTARVRLSPLEMANRQLKIYQRDEFLLYYETTWNIKNTFNIEIEWSSCMSVFIADFLKYLLQLGKFNKKILSYMVPSRSPFDIQWNFESPAEILFEHLQSIDLLERIMEEEWVWDRSGYYFHKKGLFFVKIFRERQLLLWKDNTREIMDSNESPEGQFYSFFRKACLCDIIGGILETVFRKVRI